MRNRNKLLIPLTGLILLCILVFSIRFFSRAHPRLAGRAGGAAVTRPVPVPVPQPPVALPLPVFSVPPGKGKIAIVLDDWGYTLKQVPTLMAIHRPLTVSVLPGLAHSAEVAQAARAGGHEVILHMPMEALDPKAPRERGTILTGMPRREVIERMDRSLRTVPSAKGINNHQGSKATSDAALMEIVLQETKRRGLYFLDSYVTKQSVCAEVAQRIRIPFARRSVFLDNELSGPAIQKQLMELARVAARRGQAIGIGHDRPMTLEVLRQAVPALEKAGYTLVPVSRLAEVQHSRPRD